MAYIYLMENNNGHEVMYKIGYTKDEIIQNRKKQLSTGNPYEIEPIHLFETAHNRKVETAMHHKHKYKRVSGEWFRLDIHDVGSFMSDCKSIEENLNYLRSSGNPFI